jgi:hypothetical protein
MSYLLHHRKGFTGQMMDFYEALEPFKPNNTPYNEWPHSPAQLSTALSRVSKPLDVIGITCLTKVDRRTDNGTQKDVVIMYKPGFEPPKPKFR